MRAPPSTSPVKTKMAKLLFLISLLSFVSVLGVKDKNKHEGGRKNEILDVSAVDIIREKVKNCQVEILSSCGHAITLERPWKSAKLILKFINSLPKTER